MGQNREADNQKESITFWHFAGKCSRLYVNFHTGAKKFTAGFWPNLNFPLET